MELEIEPYVLEGSCCFSHHVPFLIHYLCDAYFFFLFPPGVLFYCNLIPFQRETLNKDETLDQMNLSLTVCFIITYGLFLITLYYCLKISSYFDKPLKVCLAELSLSLFCTTKKSLKSVLLELTYTPALFSSYWKHFKQSREFF